MISIETHLGEPGEFRSLDNAPPPRDPDYVEGAILLSINGVDIMGHEEWDDVNWLWPHLTTMLEELHRGPEVSTYFPDQPTLLEFVKHPDGLVSVRISSYSGDRASQTSQKEFFSALREAGSTFFTRLAELVPAKSKMYHREHERLHAAAARLLSTE